MIPLFLPPSISQFATLSPSDKPLWHAKITAPCGKPGSLVAGLPQSIVNMRCFAQSIWTSSERNGDGYRVAKMIGRRDVARTANLRLANRCVTLVPTIPAENPEPPGTPSAMYKPDWVDPELGESVEESDEQEAIQEGLF